jgi:hypothetical protein
MTTINSLLGLSSRGRVRVFEKFGSLHDNCDQVCLLVCLDKDKSISITGPERAHIDKASTCVQEPPYSKEPHGIH